MNHLHRHAFLGLLLVAGAGCLGAPTDAEYGRVNSPYVRATFSNPGTRLETGANSIADDVLVQLIDDAEDSIDFAVMGFSRDSVIDALVRAWDRGVRLRYVGDARHLESNTQAYRVFERLNIPMIVGNTYSIMHDKFFIFDGRTVLTGTGNITTSGFTRSDNDWFVIESPQVAADFTAEFEQMFGGRFGAAKIPIDNGNTYQVGDTEIGVHFSPQDDALGEMLEAIRGARRSVHFFIFAFTKDEVGAAFIEKHLEFTHYNQCCDPELTPGHSAEQAAECAATVVCEMPFVAREVRGVIDRSQLHGNGPYHEMYRMLMWGIPMVMDGNRNSFNPGDYQAGGGRQHAKTMIIDGNTEFGQVLSGSFNWSSSATISNDETLIIARGPRISREFEFYFEQLWNRGTDPSDMLTTNQVVNPGDVVFNEIMWDGWTSDFDSSTRGPVYNDEFIELLNTTDHEIDLSLFQIVDADDFVVGFLPGTIIGPHERFLLLDHNTIPFNDSLPQDGGTAYQNADYVMNQANDQRFLRLNLRNADFYLELRDTDMNVIDIAGDGGPPCFGGREPVAGGCQEWTVACEEVDGVCVNAPLLTGPAMRNFSMERAHRPECASDSSCEVIGAGDLASSWVRATADASSSGIRDRFVDCIRATPGTENSNGSGYPDEPEGYRYSLGDTP